MVDTEFVAVGDGVDDLKIYTSYQFVTTDIPLLLRDHSKEIPVLEEVQHNVDVRLVLEYPVYRDYALATRSEGMQSNLPILEMPLPLIEAFALEAFDCEIRWADGGGVIDGEVDYAICPDTKDREQFYTAIKNMSSKKGSGGGWGYLRHVPKVEKDCGVAFVKWDRDQRPALLSMRGGVMGQ